PTPIELTCNETVFQRARQNAVESGTDPDDVDFECRLPNAFVADPPLDQVVAANLELGARGIAAGIEWHLGLFRHTNRDDIVFQTTGRATGLFGAVDRTRRSGAEIAVRSSWQSRDWSPAHTRLDATFEDTFSVLSPEHPQADEADRLPVRAGDRIPGIPRHQLKLGVDWSPGSALSMGADLVHFSGAYLRGDEANLLERTDRY